MLALVGIGGTGCKLVESFYKRAGAGVSGAAIDTCDTVSELSIPAAHKILIGRSRAKGHGAGGSTELGRKIMREEMELAMSAVKNAGFENAEVIFIAAGLGGGTATGGFALLADRIKKTYNIPVIGILVFPSKGEGALYVKNAYENFEEIRSSSDGAIALDNGVLAKRGEDRIKSYKTIENAIVNFFSLADPVETLRAVRGNVCTIGFMEMPAERISVKDLLGKMLKNYVYFRVDKIKKMHLFLRGSTDSIYGQSYANDWIKKKFGVDVEYKLMNDATSKYINAGIIISGLEDVIGKFEVQAAERRATPSELDDLLGDIKPLF